MPGKIADSHPFQHHRKAPNQGACGSTARPRGFYGSRSPEEWPQRADWLAAYAKVGRAAEKGETHGFMKVIVEAQTHAILGAPLLGTGGDEAIHSIIGLVYAKAPYTVIQPATHIHPTVSELIPTMLGELRPLSDGVGASQ